MRVSTSVTKQDCAIFYRTDRASWVVQGDRMRPEVEEQLVGLKPSESYVEIPERLLDHLVRRYVKERYGLDLDGAAQRAD
ncbi:hypothetical protein [Actinomadura oligospora]|uniref:hypothetical protein n=1 Tax=Actinomadura oligospora TaxID=111804 RepID=UPI0012F7277A|nr:hypothetical protein [Actinomadura oligospora]